MRNGINSFVSFAVFKLDMIRFGGLLGVHHNVDGFAIGRLEGVEGHFI